MTRPKPTEHKATVEIAVRELRNAIAGAPMEATIWVRGGVEVQIRTVKRL